MQEQRRQWQATPVLLPGKSHGWRSLVGCSPWGCYESDTTEWLHFHFSLSCIGEGNGNPLQCSCLENHRDGGAWWAAVYGVTHSQTQLKRLSSSSMQEGGRRRFDTDKKRKPGGHRATNYNDVAISQGVPAATRNWTSKDWVISESLLRKYGPAHTLIWGFWISELWENKFLLFLGINFW